MVMTYRERREARAARLREWADKREANAAALLAAEPSYRHDWAFITQPGPLSERTRMNARDERRYESLDKAASMNSRAAGIESQLDRAIYSDDPDARERLTERIAQETAKLETRKALNAEYRKAHRAELAAMTPYQRSQAVPFPSYAITNLSGNIARLRKRLAELP